METGPQLKVLSDRLVKPRIKPEPLVYMAKGLSTTIWQLHVAKTMEMILHKSVFSYFLSNITSNTYTIFITLTCQMVHMNPCSEQIYEEEEKIILYGNCQILLLYKI